VVWLCCQLPHQVAEIATTEIKIDASANPKLLTKGKSKPTTHGIGAHQYLLGTKGIFWCVGLELLGQSLSQAFNAVALD
jgi:hypothetical protein